MEIGHANRQTRMSGISGHPLGRYPHPPVMRVAVVPMDRACMANGHEFATLEALARRLARLHGYDYAGVHDLSTSGLPIYFVPEYTLLSVEAEALGITDAGDLFGGVVPRAFIATKVVSHPVLENVQAVPPGWSHTLFPHLSDAVLPGYSMFSEHDARRAGRRLLAGGPVRLKLARGSGGNGQVLVRNPDELDDALAHLEEDELPRHGAVIERHLHQATTCSVGTVECAGIRITYAGTQRTTCNRDGTDVYGGSDLVVARGGFDALRRVGLDDKLQHAIAQAQRYHGAMRDAYPAFFASRCNYDVVQGLDRQGAWHSGVLEQSWRLGGATPAELVALEAFAQDPSLDVVRASSHEVHGEHEPPSGAVVHYRDIDPHWGLMTKYSLLQRHGYPA
ncbi:MAG: DUF3182 family protein [Achromobacter pestifer]